MKGVIFCPSCIHEEPLKFQSCPGKFVIKRAAGDRLVRLLVETPCSDHILPPRIRQTTAEKEHHAAVVKAHGRVPISQRDPAGMVNSELHRKRTYRIRSTLKSSGLDKLDELSCLGEYTSTPDYSRLLIKAPYESTFQKRGNTFFIDSTYKVVGPAKDDMRKGPQLIVLSSYSLILAKHIVLRGMFTKPATRAEYRVFFKSVFSTYGLPSTKSYLGFVGDFATAQLQGYVIEFTLAKQKKNYSGDEEEAILSNETLVLSALKFWRGCLFHYEKALIDISHIIDDDCLYQEIRYLLDSMRTETRMEVYLAKDIQLVKRAAMAGMLFIRWLKWWRELFFGARFRVVHLVFLSANQRLISPTNNPQEGLHRMIKHDFLVKRTSDFVEAGRRFTECLNATDTSLHLVALGYTSAKKSKKPATKYPRTRVTTASTPLEAIDTDYELTFGATRGKKGKKGKLLPESLQETDPTKQKNKPRLILKKGKKTDLRVIQSIASWDWRNNSCSFDASISAFLILYSSYSKLFPNSFVGSFYSAFLEQLRTNATPKSTVVANLNRLYHSILLPHLGYPSGSELWGDIQERLRIIARDLDPQSQRIRFITPCTDLDEAVSTLKVKLSPLTIETDIEYYQSNHCDIDEDVVCLVVSSGAFRNLFTEGKRIFSMQIHANQRLWRLTSVIFLGPGHFNTVLFMGNQSSDNHIIPFRSDYTHMREEYLPNGMWSHDPFASQSGGEAPHFSHFAEHTQVSHWLNGQGSSPPVLDKSTAGTCFSRSATFQPIFWIYTFESESSKPLPSTSQRIIQYMHQHPPAPTLIEIRDDC